MRGLRIHVLGDAIRDVYTQARCLGAASKSPTLVYERGASKEWIGGAGVIAEHCRAAGAEVMLTTRGETVKERIIVNGMKVVEFHAKPTDDEWRGHHVGPLDVAIFADFQHGTFSGELLGQIAQIDGAHPGILMAADSQTTGISWGNILDFSACDLLFANEREARYALKDARSPAEELGEKLQQRSGRIVFLKRGEHGLTIHEADRTLEIRPFARKPIVDPIGAGDALLAYATMTYRITKDLKQAGIIGSLAAAVACANEGNVPVTPAAIMELCA